MKNLFDFQYKLIKESREVVLQFLESEVQEDIFKPVLAFGNKNINYMLVHVANTYIAWVNNFVSAGDKPYFAEHDITHVGQLRKMFAEVDSFMAGFCISLSADPQKLISGFKWADKYIETDAYSIFTHVITHEFHHKGQSMTMSRVLGHTPPDTDVMRF